MRLFMLKSKIHRATVTAADVDYEGSLMLDEDLMDAANILPNEQIHVWDVTNGNRIITYAIVGERGSGVVQVNGGGAHKIHPGDIIIVATFAMMTGKKARKFRPTVVHADESNRPSLSVMKKRKPKPETLPEVPEDS
jgi:aspartate 1-decarboxylase